MDHPDAPFSWRLYVVAVLLGVALTAGLCWGLQWI